MPGTRGAPTRGAHPGMRGAVAGRGAPRPSAPMGRGLPTRAPPARVVEEDGYGYVSIVATRCYKTDVSHAFTCLRPP